AIENVGHAEATVKAAVARQRRALGHGERYLAGAGDDAAGTRALGGGEARGRGRGACGRERSERDGRRERATRPAAHRQRSSTSAVSSACGSPLDFRRRSASQHRSSRRARTGAGAAPGPRAIASTTGGGLRTTRAICSAPCPRAASSATALV